MANKTSSVTFDTCANSPLCTKAGYVNSSTHIIPGERQFLRCGGCRSAAYCSRECQKQHWRGGHKHQCRAVPRSAGSRSARQKPAVVALMKMLLNEQCVCDPRGSTCANGCRLRSNGLITSAAKQVIPAVSNCLRKVVSFIHQTGALICTICRGVLDASEKKQAFVANACPPVVQAGGGAQA